MSKRKSMTKPRSMIPIHHERCVCKHCRCQHVSGFAACERSGCRCIRYTWPGPNADLPKDHAGARG